MAEKYDLIQMGEQALTAKYEASLLTTEQKNTVLTEIAQNLRKECGSILTANAEDVREGIQAGMSQGLLDRLKLTEERISQIAEGLVQITKLPDPVGNVLEKFTRPNGLLISKVSVPMGVIGIIYESRPNVTADAFGLCFKAGNVVILKGGSDALHSNIAITNVIRETLEKNRLNPDMIQLITATDRAVTAEFMKMKGYVDVLIPRGGAGLIKAVVENATIPVIETGTGNCHIYIDKDADIEKAVKIIVNAKTQRIGVCNACESLVIHKDIIGEALPAIAKALREKHCELRGDEAALEVVPDMKKATEEDWGTEYLDLIASVRTVASVDEAIEHINRYNTGHSEAIVTKDYANARKFLEKGNKVKVTLRFRGRELAHVEQTKGILDEFAEKLSDIAVIDKPAKFEGRSMIMFLTEKR